jgi:hypothetical protein
MSLSSDNDANVALLMGWLRDSQADASAVGLREELAYLLFLGDPTWANNEDSSSISTYRGIFSTWLSEDSSDESQFLALTPPGDESATAREMFVNWLTPVVQKWKQSAKDTEGNTDRGLENPEYAADQTPGTQFYWYDPDNEVYLYASTADAPDNEWLSYEDRRYTPVAHDDARQTNFRQDVVTGDYEFQSKVTSAKWLTTAEWNEEVAVVEGRTDESGGADGPLYTAPVYDAGFGMYRRFNSVTREYEYADDPADVVWLSVAEATARMSAASGPVPPEQQQAAAQTVYDEIVLPAVAQLESSGHPGVAALLSRPGGREQLEAEVMKATSQMLANSTVS